jgi:hypothetical protein
MTQNKRAILNVSAVIAFGAMYCSTSAFAQESANGDLDSCVKKEQILTTAKGAGAGALAGLTAMLVSNKKDDAVKGALIGAAVGGVAGFATAYYTAIDTCYKKNPSWMPESKIEHTKDYDKVRKEIHYNPKQGIVTRAEAVQVADPVKAASQAEVNSTFIVMAPNGAEAPVTIDRKLYVIENDQPKELLFPGQKSEQHTFQSGEQRDTVHIPIPPDAKPGTTYRVDFSVAADGQPPSSKSSTFVVAQ